MLDDVQDAYLSGLNCSPASGPTSLVRVVQSQNVLIRGSRPCAAEAAFLKIEGPASSGIALLGNDLTRSARAADLGPDVPPNALLQAGNLDQRSLPSVSQPRSNRTN